MYILTSRIFCFKSKLLIIYINEGRLIHRPQVCNRVFRWPSTYLLRMTITVSTSVCDDELNIKTRKLAHEVYMIGTSDWNQSRDVSLHTNTHTNHFILSHLRGKRHGLEFELTDFQPITSRHRAMIAFIVACFECVVLPYRWLYYEYVCEGQIVPKW